MNEGNSGGPVFLNEKVVGVSTQKLAAVSVEGLNFAVHYGEVLQFLEANHVKPEN
jgi:serine protease Do